MLSLLSFTLKLKKSFLFFVLNCEEILQTFTLTTYVKVIGGVQNLLFNPLFCVCSFDENSPEAFFFFFFFFNPNSFCCNPVWRVTRLLFIEKHWNSLQPNSFFSPSWVTIIKYKNLLFSDLHSEVQAGIIIYMETLWYFSWEHQNVSKNKLIWSQISLGIQFTEGVFSFNRSIPCWTVHVVSVT